METKTIRTIQNRVLKIYNHMQTIETKIRKALETNKLNPEILGERNWYNYYISVIELVWARNLYDGY